MPFKTEQRATLQDNSRIAMAAAGKIVFSFTYALRRGTSPVLFSHGKLSRAKAPDSAVNSYREKCSKNRRVDCKIYLGTANTKAKLIKPYFITYVAH